jgi:hypothetical protein
MDVVSSKLKLDFNELGYCIEANAISHSKAEELKALVLDMALHEKKKGNSYVYPFDPTGNTQRVWNLTNKSSEFRKLLEADLLYEMMEFIFDRPTSHQLFHLSSFQANVIHPGAPRQKLHMDTPFPEPVPLWPAKANSIWMLDDFTESNGATEVVPRSHKLDHKPKPQDDTDSICEKIIGMKGSVIFTHGNLWHRAGANESETIRVGLLCSFAASYIKEIGSEEDQSLVINEKIKIESSERLKSILGIGHGLKDGAFVVHDCD